MHHELFTTEGAAAYLKCSVPYVRRMKREGGGPRYIQRGKFIRYRKIDLDCFMEANLQSGNSAGFHAFGQSDAELIKETTNRRIGGLNQRRNVPQ